MQALSLPELCAQALALPDEIAAVEADYAAAQLRLEEAKQLLADHTADLLDSELITGKNAEQRAAQVRKLTSQTRAEVLACEVAVSGLKRACDHMNRRLAVLRVVIAALGGKE